MTKETKDQEGQTTQRTPRGVGPVASKARPSKATRTLYLVLGLVMAGIGLLGVVLPILPTTGPVLMAAWFFARSSPRLGRWLTEHRVLGPYILAYTEKRGLSLGRKLWVIGVLWAGMTPSILFITGTLGDIILLVIAVAVTIHVATIRGQRPCTAREVVEAAVATVSSPALPVDPDPAESGA